MTELEQRNELRKVKAAEILNRQENEIPISEAEAGDPPGVEFEYTLTTEGMQILDEALARYRETVEAILKKNPMTPLRIQRDEFFEAYAIWRESNASEV